TVRVTYIGYAPFGISNIRVSSGTTTTQDVELTSSAVQVQGVEIVAERALIQRNTTNTVRLATTETIERLPFRGVDNILALQAGVVKQDDKLYVRGGRAGETAYFVDGANVTNPFFNAENVSVIQEAIEELAIQSGGFTAEFGGANSAIVRTSVRTGGSNLHVSLDYQTDDFAKPGQTFLGTSAFGYRNAVLTVGGPIPYITGAKLFVAGQHNYVRNRQQMYLTPFRFEGLTSDGFGGRPAGELLPENGTVEFKRNYLYKNWLETNTIQGTVSYDMNPLKFRLTGSYANSSLPRGAAWPGVLGNYFRLNRSMMEETITGFVNFRTTHVLGPSTFYEIGISYTKRNQRVFDPDFGDNWPLYSDSIANAQKGYTGFLRRFSGPLDYSTIYAFTFNDPNAPNNSYSKNQQTSISGVIDFTSQITSNWEVKAGGRIDSWVMRNYSISNIEAANVFLYGLYGTQPRSFASSEERKVRLARTASINFFGYDVDGNEVDAGFDEPRKPLFASAYLQNRFEYRDIILNLGVRYELYDTKAPVPPDPTGASGFDQSLDFIDESQLVKKDPQFYLLPRISFSFPASDRTVFYAQFGKYVQLPELSRIFHGNFILSRNISPLTRGPWGSAGGFPPSFMVVPERTTQYEIGLRQIVADNFAFTITGFYKNVKDQLQYNKYPSMDQPLYVAWRNEDFSSTRGIELTLELRRTQRLAARVNYMMSDARGTASDAFEWYGPVSDITINSRFPVFINPLQFNQTHRGSISLDYRFSKGDGGPILEGTGLNFILTFNSGHSYTKILNAFGA
ncbi:MAG: TonB-dependent receptor, partial [Bacteroidota bacterium]